MNTEVLHRKLLTIISVIQDKLSGQENRKYEITKYTRC